MTVLTCIEVGGSGAETVSFSANGTATFLAGAVPDGDLLAIAVPGIVDCGRVLAASNLGWFDVDPAEALHLGRDADLVMNDGEAQALGEAELRGVDDITVVALGTGVGGAVVRDGRVVADNLFGHVPGYSRRVCACGATGCLETVAAGWALPKPLAAEHLGPVASALADAIEREAVTDLVVISGGLARRHPTVVSTVASLLPNRSVEPSAAPADAKSAAAWGLRRAVLGEGVRRP